MKVNMCNCLRLFGLAGKDLFCKKQGKNLRGHKTNYSAQVGINFNNFTIARKRKQ
jgi:hypothetical protein